MKLKKSISGIAAAFIMCSAVLSGCSSGNALSDGSSNDSGKAKDPLAVVTNDFEVNYDGWVPTNNAVTLTATEGMGNDGSRGMLVTNRGSASDSVYSLKGMYLAGGIDYNYSIMVYSETAETFHLKLGVSQGPAAEKDTEIASVTTEAGTWTKLSGDFTAPEGSRSFKLTLNTSSASDFRFDDVVVSAKDKKSAEKTAVKTEKGLKDEFANYFRVGNILNGGSIKDGDITANVLMNYNSITCENEMKPDSTLVQKLCTEDNIAVSISKAAPIMDFCVNNNISLRGHVLVWHSQTPAWFFKEDFKNSGEWVTPEVMDKRMESYIKNIFETIQTQYPGLDLYAYDVVNEAVSDDNARNLIYGGAREPGDNNQSNGKSAWVQVYGDNSFIEKAFVYARKYAPEGCKLYYNDYNEYWDHKRDKIYAICKNLYDKGLLDGIGMQSHVNADINGFSGAPSHAEAMKIFLSIGCDVQITELDMSCEGGKLSAEQQAEKCKAIFQAAVDYNNNPEYEGRVTAVCIWGPNDANTWISPENAPLLYDTNNQPKPAYTALTEMISADQWGDGKNPVTTDRPKREVNLAPTEGDTVTAVHKKPEEEPAPEPVVYDTAGDGNYSDDFEGNTGDWFGRGSAAISVSNDAAFSGESSLYVEGRTAAWNGTARLLAPEEFTAGFEYSFKVNVMFNDGDDTDTFYMKLQYTDADGNAQYASVAEGTANKGEWITLENEGYQIPSDATDMQIYVETANSTNNFYIDCAEGNAKAS